MQWLIPLAIWSNDIILLLGTFFAKDFMSLKIIIYTIVLLDVIATIYWKYDKDKRKARILDAVIYTENGVLNIEGKRKDLEVILSSASDIVKRTKGHTIKIKLRR